MAWSELPGTQNKSRNTASDRALVIRRENLPNTLVGEGAIERDRDGDRGRERERTVFLMSINFWKKFLRET